MAFATPVVVDAAVVDRVAVELDVWVAVLVLVVVREVDRVGDTIVVFRVIGMVIPVEPAGAAAVIEALTDATIDDKAEESSDETTELIDETREDTD